MYSINILFICRIFLFFEVDNVLWPTDFQGGGQTAYYIYFEEISPFL